MSFHIPTRSTIKRVFKGDKDYFDKAAAIVERWYKLEGARYDSIRDFLEAGYDDIKELADAVISEEKRHIVWMALEGYDPYEKKEE